MTPLERTIWPREDLEQSLLSSTEHVKYQNARLNSFEEVCMTQGGQFEHAL